MARLPIPGGDDGDWGTILNTFLSQSHNDDGTLKAGVVGAAALKAGAVSSGALASGAVTAAKLSAGTGGDGQALVFDSTVSGKLKWVSITGVGGTAPPSGPAGGDLAGTYPNPTVPGLASKANTTDVYTKTQVDTALGTKANSTDTYTKSQVDTALAGKMDNVTLAPVATTGSYTDLANKPTIPAAQVNSDWNATSGIAQILNKPTLFSGDYTDLTGTPTLFSGDYTDLTNKPTLFSGSYADLTNKPTIPAQFNPTAGTNVTLTGTYPDITISATPGAGVTDLTTTTTATTVTVESSTGTDATISSATTSSAGILTASDKSKLDGIASGAEANVQADWNATTGDAQILNKPTLFSGSYTDLTNKPTIPAAQVNSDWNAASGVAEILNKPTLGTAASADSDDFATAAQGTKADSAVQPGSLSDYATTTALTNGLADKADAADVYTKTEMDSSLADKADTSSLAAVATSGDYADLSNTPTAFSGSYDDLTDKPTVIAAGADIASARAALNIYLVDADDTGTYPADSIVIRKSQ